MKKAKIGNQWYLVDEVEMVSQTEIIVRGASKTSGSDLKASYIYRVEMQNTGNLQDMQLSTGTDVKVVDFSPNEQIELEKVKAEIELAMKHKDGILSNIALREFMGK